MNSNDVIAYLMVLDHTPVLERLYLSESERLAHSRNICGCLCRITDSLEQAEDPDERGLLELVRYRERLNGFQPKDHPQLQSATRQLSKVLWLWLMENRNGKRHN